MRAMWRTARSMTDGALPALLIFSGFVLNFTLLQRRGQPNPILQEI